MLVKAICKKCISERLPWGWTEDAEIGWSVGGRVDCPVSGSDLTDFMRFVEGMPPKPCPYFMEQLILNQIGPQEKNGGGSDSMNQDMIPSPDGWLIDTLEEKEGEP